MRDHGTQDIDDQTMVLVSVAKRQWERTFDAISDPLMLVDGGYVVKRANLALADDLGLAIQRVVGQRCHELRAESARPFPRSAAGPCDGCPVAAARTHQSAREGDLRAPAVARTYHLRAYPLLDETEPLTVCIYHDVSDELEMSRALAAAERLAAIGRLAGGVAHEINNPLGGILACTQILQRAGGRVEEHAELLSDIQSSVLRCKRIVEGLLRFARQLGQSQREPLDVGKLAQEAVARFVHRSGTGESRIACSAPSGLPAVLGDADQLMELIAQLLAHACHSSAGDGVIDVGAEAHDGEILLHVRHSGAGITEEDLGRLFDPFFTPKDEGTGAGLDLAVSWAIVQEHGGRIVAAQRPSGSAEITVRLPCAAQGAPGGTP